MSAIATATDKKSSSKRKHAAAAAAALAAAETRADEENLMMTSEEKEQAEEEDDGLDLDTSAPPPAQPAKKHKKKKTHEETTSHAAAASSSSTERVKSVQEMLASLSDAEKATFGISMAPASSTALVPAAAAAAGAATTEVVKYTRANPRVETLEEVDDDEVAVDDPMKGMSLPERMKFIYHRDLALAKKGAVLVTNPDLAVALWSASTNKRISFFELDDQLQHIQVKRSSDKGGKEAFMNCKLKGDQTFDPELVPNMFGLTMMSSFSSTAFFKHGPTVETGVNGSQGKMINNKPVEDGKENYEVTLTNKPWTQLVVDSNFDNPVFNYFTDVWQRMVDRCLVLAFADGKAMAEARQFVTKSHKTNKVPAVMPTTGEEWVAALKQLSKCKTLLRVGDEESTERGLTLSTSCYRSMYGEKVGDVRHVTEKLTHESRPSQMFIDHPQNRKKEPQVHHNLPVFRGRRHDELVKGQTYPSPFILIGMSNAVLSGGDSVISAMFNVGIYEWKFETTGATGKQLAYFWLGKAADLKKIRREDIVPVDGRYAIPMAQPYHGPMDSLEEAMAAASGPEFDGMGVSFAPRAAAAASSATPAKMDQDPDHSGFAS